MHSKVRIASSLCVLSRCLHSATSNSRRQTTRWRRVFPSSASASKNPMLITHALLPCRALAPLAPLAPEPRLRRSPLVREPPWELPPPSSSEYDFKRSLRLPLLPFCGLELSDPPASDASCRLDSSRPPLGSGATEASRGLPIQKRAAELANASLLQNCALLSMTTFQ